MLMEAESMTVHLQVKRTLGGSTRPNVHNNQPTATRELQFDSSSPSSNGYYIYNVSLFYYVFEPIRNHGSHKSDS